GSGPTYVSSLVSPQFAIAKTRPFSLDYDCIARLRFVWLREAMPGRTIRTFTVLPHLPDRLRPLRDLAYNLWWSWNHDAISLFRRIDPDLFEAVESSPVKLLGLVPQSRYDQLLADDGFLAHMDRVHDALEAYMGAESWFQEAYPETTDPE